jgi:hypothetical protein
MFIKLFINPTAHKKVTLENAQVTKTSGAPRVTESTRVVMGQHSLSNRVNIVDTVLMGMDHGDIT